MAAVVAHCDGSILKNPGGEGFTGWLVQDEAGTVLVERSKALGSGPHMTVNFVEYSAILQALEWVLANRPEDELVVKSDSQLVIRQLSGVYGVHSQGLRDLKKACMAVVRCMRGVVFEWIPREENVEADRLSKSLWKNVKNVDKS